MIARLNDHGLIDGLRTPTHAWRDVVRRDPCPYCVVFPDRARADDRAMNIEHVVPSARGGRDACENLVGAHTACNSSRGTRGLLMFLLERQFVTEYLQDPALTRQQRARARVHWRSYFCPGSK